MVTTGVVFARFIGKSRVQISAKSMVAQSKVCSIHYYDSIQFLLYILACCGRVVCGVELGYFFVFKWALPLPGQETTEHNRRQSETI